MEKRVARYMMDRQDRSQNTQMELEQINKAIKDYGIKQPEETPVEEAQKEEPIEEPKEDK